MWAARVHPQRPNPVKAAEVLVRRRDILAVSADWQPLRPADGREVLGAEALVVVRWINAGSGLPVGWQLADPETE